MPIRPEWCRFLLAKSHGQPPWPVPVGPAPRMVAGVWLATCAASC
jgi:hypothetical protein